MSQAELHLLLSHHYKQYMMLKNGIVVSETQKHIDYMVYRDKIIADALHKVYLVGRRTHQSKFHCDMSILPKEILHKIQRMAQRQTTYKITRPTNGWFNGFSSTECAVAAWIAIMKQNYVCLLKSSKILRNSHFYCVCHAQVVAHFVVRALFPYHLPCKHWKTADEWIRDYGIKKKWLYSQRRRFASALKTTLFGPRRTLDLFSLENDIQEFLFKTNIMNNVSCWKTSPAKTMLDNKENNRILLAEPLHVTAEDALHFLKKCFGDMTEKCIFVKGTRQGCQVFFIGRNVNKQAILNNCLFEGFAHAETVDGRVRSLAQLNDGFAIPLDA